MAHFIPSAGVQTKGSYNSTTTPLTAKLGVRSGQAFRNSEAEFGGEKLALDAIKSK
jgi:hypothetical protein